MKNILQGSLDFFKKYSVQIFLVALTFLLVRGVMVSHDVTFTKRNTKLDKVLVVEDFNNI